MYGEPAPGRLVRTWKLAAGAEQAFAETHVNSDDLDGGVSVAVAEVVGVCVAVGDVV